MKHKKHILLNVFHVYENNQLFYTFGKFNIDNHRLTIYFKQNLSVYEIWKRKLISLTIHLFQKINSQTSNGILCRTIITLKSSKILILYNFVWNDALTPIGILVVGSRWNITLHLCT